MSSVDNIYPKIVNGVVKAENLHPDILKDFNKEFNVTSPENVTITTENGTVGEIDAKSINITTGQGYVDAAAGEDADGGNINIQAGQANGDGDAGDILIAAGNAGDGDDANAGTLTLRSGSGGNADNSDAHDVEIYGGDAVGVGDSDGGDIRLEAGDASDDGQAGGLFLYAGNSGNGDGSTGDNPEAGSVEITAGNSNSTTNTNGGYVNIDAGNATGNGSGGDISIVAGDSGTGSGDAGDIVLVGGSTNGTGRPGRVVLNSMALMPVYANNTARDAAAGTPTEGMFCYNSTTGNIEVYLSGAWKSVDVSAIV